MVTPSAFPGSRGMRIRIVVVHAIVFGGCWIALVARATTLAAFEPALRELGETQSAGVVTWDDRRGAIRDRQGNSLAVSVESDSVFIRPFDVGDREATAGLLAQTLGLPAEEVLGRLVSPRSFVWVKRFTSLAEGARVRALRLRGVGTASEARRAVTRAGFADAVIGSVTVDGVGASGIEQRFDPELRGKRVRAAVLRDARGTPMASRVGDARAPAIAAGSDVTLTIDGEIQFAAEEALREGVKAATAKGGIAIVVDPGSGAILALAERSAMPGGTRIAAVQTPIEPGSTLKALLFGLALSTGLDVRETVFCERGEMPLSGGVVRDDHRFGWLTWADVLKLSSNIGAAKLGRRMGAERFVSGLAAFGFGAATDVDLPGEVAGSLRAARDWGEFGLATASFGQGISATPVQLMMAFSAIANGGELLTPQIVARIDSAAGERLWASSRRVVRRVLSADVARELRRLLARVVEQGGTAPAARVRGVPVAGKTGTSQKPDPEGGYSSDGRIASFVGFAPVVEPKLVVGIWLDEPQKSPYGGVVAAPVFAKIVEVAARVLAVPVVPGGGD
ncbi:MAG: penicillin-binding protein 2 [Deltaproteobacteria bacterium]|nr:penicillin-binding protein 2 [Deltaproteobacteria bacterium]